MSDPDVKRGERIAEQIQAATWYTDEYLGTIIWARNPFGSGDDFRVADIRGWGHLTGQCALRMDPSAAEITQMALATHIVNCHNNRADLAAERERELVTALDAALSMIEHSLTGLINPDTGVKYRKGVDDLALTTDGSMTLLKARALTTPEPQNAGEES